MDVPYNTEEPRVERQSNVDIQRIARRLENAELRRIERFPTGSGQRSDPCPSPSRDSVKTTLLIILLPVLLAMAYFGFKIFLLLIIAIENIL